MVHIETDYLITKGSALKFITVCSMDIRYNSKGICTKIQTKEAFEKKDHQQLMPQVVPDLKLYNVLPGSATTYTHMKVDDDANISSMGTIHKNSK
jgi:hypothetical protein